MTRLTLLLIFSAALAWGQAMDNFAWWDSPIVQNLNLTPDQQRQIRATVREFRDRMIEQRASVQKAEANLGDFMNDDPVNEAKGKDVIDKLVVARGDLMRSVSQMSLKLRTVLTPQQWQELQRRRAGLAAEGRGAPPLAQRPQLQQRLRARGAMAPAARQQIQQRLRQIDKRLEQGGDLTPAERQQLLEHLRQIEQTLQEGAPPPPAGGPQPQRRGPAQQPPPPGQQF